MDHPLNQKTNYHLLYLKNFGRPARNLLVRTHYSIPTDAA